MFIDLQFYPHYDYNLIVSQVRINIAHIISITSPINDGDKSYVTTLKNIFILTPESSELVKQVTNSNFYEEGERMYGKS